MRSPPSNALRSVAGKLTLGGQPYWTLQLPFLAVLRANALAVPRRTKNNGIWQHMHLVDLPLVLGAIVGSLSSPNVFISYASATMRLKNLNVYSFSPGWHRLTFFS